MREGCMGLYVKSHKRGTQEMNDGVKQGKGGRESVESKTETIGNTE